MLQNVRLDNAAIAVDGSDLAEAGKPLELADGARTQAVKIRA